MLSHSVFLKQPSLLTTIVQTAIEDYNKRLESIKEMKNSKKSLMQVSLNINNRQALIKNLYNNNRETQKFEGIWTKFFLDFESRTSQSLQHLTFQNQFIQQQCNTLIDQNRSLFEQNQELQESLKYMKEHEKKREQHEIEQQNRIEKRKLAKKAPTREAITAQEFIKIIDFVNNNFQNPLTIARVKTALVLLYTTGLRISNLLLLRKRDITQLLNEGECNINLIKGGPQKQLLHIGCKGRALLRDLSRELTVIDGVQKEENAPFFISKLDTQKAISPRNFRGQLNKVLQYASVILKKHIRSDSFRATFITDLLELGIPIEQARDIVGHRDIATTATYRRSRMNIKELRKTITSVNQSRIQNCRIRLGRNLPTKSLTRKCFIGHF